MHDEYGMMLLCPRARSPGLPSGQETHDPSFSYSQQPIGYWMKFFGGFLIKKIIFLLVTFVSPGRI